MMSPPTVVQAVFALPRFRTLKETAGAFIPAMPKSSGQARGLPWWQARQQMPAQQPEAQGRQQLEAQARARLKREVSAQPR